MNEKELYHMINTEGLREVCSTISCSECPLAANCNDSEKCWDKMKEFYKNYKPVPSEDKKVIVVMHDPSSTAKVFARVPEPYLEFLDYVNEEELYEALKKNGILTYHMDDDKEITEF